MQVKNSFQKVQVKFFVLERRGLATNTFVRKVGMDYRSAATCWNLCKNRPKRLRAILSPKTFSFFYSSTHSYTSQPIIASRC